METRRPPTGIVVLEWFFIILGVISILAGIVVPPIVMAIVRAAMTQAEPALEAVSSILGLIALFLGLFCIAYGVFQVLIGVFLGKGKGWARIAALVVGITSLLNVPIGTVLGVLCLVFLLGEEGKAYFRT